MIIAYHTPVYDFYNQLVHLPVMKDSIFFYFVSDGARDFESGNTLLKDVPATHELEKICVFET